VVDFVCIIYRGVDPYGTEGTRHLDWGGHYQECPPQYFWSNISYFLSVQYFIDKLEELSAFSQKDFFSTGCNILRIQSKKRQITFCQGLQGLCSTPAVRPYTVPGGVAQFECDHLFGNIFIIISEPPQCFSTRRLWIRQRSSLVNPTIVRKLKCIHIKNYISRRS